jgi:NADH dehydrogenase/NADH:ubiquinone oxidoreductase subunit G
MVDIKLNGVKVWAEDGWSLLETVRFYGLNLPTLCHQDGLKEYGGCRLCLVEIGEGERSKLVTACTHPVWEGLSVRSHSKWAVETRKVVLELLVARCPTSRTLQDMAARMALEEVRFKARHEDCTLCGLCVRICGEQMNSGAIGFVSRGENRDITTPFDVSSDECRRCGGCMYICPACQSRCQGPDSPGVLCGSCMSMRPTCLDIHDDAKCFMSETSCGTCLRRSDLQGGEEDRGIQEGTGRRT